MTRRENIKGGLTAAAVLILACSAEWWADLILKVFAQC